MNSWSIIGRLGRDAEIKYLPSGELLCEISVAVNHGYGDGKRTNWVRGKLWGRLAESRLIPKLKRGVQVGLVGALELVEWEKNGTNKSLLILNIKQIDLLGGEVGREIGHADKAASKSPFHADDGFDDIPF